MTGQAGVEHDGHDHGRPRIARLLMVTLLTVAMVATEVAGGLLTHSLALLADAGHMLTDVVALLLSLFAVWLTQRPTSTQRTFGYRRAEILAALLNGLLLIIIAGSIVVEAVQRLRAPLAVASTPMLVIATLGLVVNIASAGLLHGDSHRSLNSRSVYIHMLTDVFGSVGAMLAGLAILLTGWTPADPWLSIGIALLIVWSTWRLLRDTVNVLLEAAPASVDVVAVQRAMGQVAGVVNIHDLHIWQVSDNFVSLSCHVEVQDPALDRGILRQLRHLLQEQYGITHVTLQLESAAETPILPR